MKELEGKILEIINLNIEEFIDSLIAGTNISIKEMFNAGKAAIEIAALIEPYKKLVEAQDELITFYGGIIDSSAMFLHVHHWEESTENIEKGRNLREKIEQLKKELE